MTWCSFDLLKQTREMDFWGQLLLFAMLQEGVDSLVRKVLWKLLYVLKSKRDIPSIVRDISRSKEVIPDAKSKPKVDPMGVR